MQKPFLQKLLTTSKLSVGMIKRVSNNRVVRYTGAKNPMMSTDDPQKRFRSLHILKRRVNAENASLRSHLKSIIHDSQLVVELKEFLPQYPLFANLYVHITRQTFPKQT